MEQRLQWKAVLIRTAADVCRGRNWIHPKTRKKSRIMQKLIAMRKQEAACKSLYFHFPNEYEKRRLVEYIKLDQTAISWKYS